MKTELKNIIEADLFRIHGDISSKTLHKVLKYPGFRYLFYLRKSNLSKYKILRKYYAKKLKRLVFKYGFQILPRTNIGKGLRIYHFGNIIINPNAIIGDYCTLYPNIVVGNIDYGKKQEHPR